MEQTTEINSVHAKHIDNTIAGTTIEARAILGDDHPAVAALGEAMRVAVAAQLPEAERQVLSEHDGTHPDGWYRLTVNRAWELARAGA